MTTHKECQNFRWREGGWCSLKEKKVNPDDPSCDQFKARDLNKVRFDFPPEKFPKGAKGSRRLYFEYMLLRKSFKEKLTNPKAGFGASLEEHAKYYILILEEMKRRGLKLPEPTGHPIERYAHQFSKLVPVAKRENSNAVYLVSHAEEVYDGSKILWVTKKAYPGMLNKPLILAGSGKVWGVVKLLHMSPITPKEFDEARALHKVTKEEQEEWWPGAKLFYAYPFTFKPFKKPKPFKGLPKGPQVFFTIRSKLTKAAQDIRFEFVGTKAFVEFPPKLKGGETCRADWCVDPINLKRKHSGLCIDNRVLIDGCGWDWRDSKHQQIAAVVLTHLHPDHAGALWKGEDSKLLRSLKERRVPIHVWKGALDIKEGSMAKPLDEGLHVLVHQPGGKFTVGNHTYRFFPVYHSVVAPAAAVLIDDRLMYASDFLGWKGINPLMDRDIDLYIGDGSSMKKDETFTAEGEERNVSRVGHMSMVNQARMCSKAKVKHIKFTHVGLLYMRHSEAKDTLRIICKSKGYYPDPNDVYIAEDGDFGSLLSNGSIRWRGKIIHKASEFFKPNKPYWREFENEKIPEIRGFTYPAKVEIKIDGMRFQINTKMKTLRSEDEGFHKERMFKRAVAEMSKLPPDSIFDSEGVMLDDKGKPMHRTAITGYANSKAYDEDKDSRAEFWIFDVFRIRGRDVHELPFAERLKILKGIKDTKHFTIMRENKHYWICKSPKELASALKRVRHVPGSEGAMVIWDQGLETKTNQNRSWAKIKNLYEVDVLVTDRTHPKRKETGEEIKSVWNYMIAAGPYEGRCAEVAKKLAPRGKIVIKEDGSTMGTGIIEKEGRVYAYLGRTFNTKIDAPVGGIIRVFGEEINKFQILDKSKQPTGCFTYGLYLPKVLEYVREKDVPDGMKVLERLSALTPQRKLTKALELDDKTYKEIRAEGEPLNKKYYKFQPRCKPCRGVVQRHYPTGRIVEVEEVKKGILIEGLKAKSFWKDSEGALNVEVVGSRVEKTYNTKRLVMKFRDHIDLRLERDHELIGVTIHPPVPAGKNTWDVFKERVAQGEKSQCTVKYPHPKSWLTYQGTLYFPTIHGGHRLEIAKMEIKDRIHVEYGVQRKNLHEWFIRGEHLKGRFVLRVILSPSTQKPIWILVRPKENQWPLNPTLHKDEGDPDLVRNDKLTPEMARSPVRKS